MSESAQSSNRIAIYAVLAVVLAIGVWLRWQFIHTVQLYPDEFVTLLAVQMIGEKGLPVMPSGLFYEHGLLFSYLGSLASLLGSARITVRYASLLCGTVTLLLTFWVGRRWFSPVVGLMAVTGLAVAPTAIHWSGRARMYALLQLLILLTLWLAYESVIQNKVYLRGLALLIYLAATLTHFVAVTLAPPLILAMVAVWWFQVRKHENQLPITNYFSPLIRRFWPEGLTLGGILIIAFLIKRLGQPKGIEALEGNTGQAVSGVFEVFSIYSDFSFNINDGWQAIAPFYLTLPALIFTPFALIAVVNALKDSLPLINRKSKTCAGRRSKSVSRSIQNRKFQVSPALFLSLILLITTLEMILIVSPDRRDDKYQFMLLPVLLLLGAWGMVVVGKWLLVISKWLWVRLNDQLSIVNRKSKIANLLPVLVSGLIILASWPSIQALLNNTGDDYDSAFAFVQENWQDGDTILTGTPAAAALYLGRNDFYSVQRRGGYDYRILTVDGQPVDRWLASPAIRTESALHQTFANNTVWLVLERWGLQKEYYDIPFQQQLLAQTDYVTEFQGIFVLRSKANPQPIALEPDQSADANFNNLVRLTGYTVEPDELIPGQPLRLTLYWQALAPMLHDYTVFVHLRNQDGSNVAQSDHRPLGSMYPTSIWPAGETIRESSELFLPPDLPPGDYGLWAGLYLLETGERLPIQNDTSGENAVRLGVLIVGQ